MAYGWAAAICTALPAPPTPSNLRGLNSWITCENGPKVTGNNPLNTSLDCCGAIGMKNSVIPNYPNPAMGVLATVRTLHGGYSNAVSSLRRGTLGRDMRQNANRILTRDDGLHWGTSPSCIASGLGGAAPGTAGGSSSGTSSSSGPSLKDKATATLGLGAVGGAGLLLVVAVLVLGGAAWFLLRKKAA